jgi:hypothetical protein
MPANHVRIVAVFRSTTTGIEVVGANNYSPLQAYAQNGMLYISGLTAGETFSVYNLTGTLIYTSPNPSERGEIAVPLPQRGVYIIRSGDKTVKAVN